jgi:hypothetical protein
VAITRAENNAARTNSFDEFLASLKPKRSGSPSSQLTISEDVRAFARERTLRLHGLVAQPIDRDHQTDLILETTRDLLISAELRQEWNDRQFNVQKANYEVVKLKAREIISKHMHDTNCANTKIPDRLIRKMHDCSRSLYRAELAAEDEWKSIEWETQQEITDRMTQVFVHPNSLARVIANRRRERDITIERIRSILRTLCIYAATAFVILVAAIFQHEIIHFDKVTHHISSIALGVAVLLAMGWRAYKWSEERDRRSRERHHIEAEQIKLKQEAEERYRLYRENRDREERALKKCVLNGLKGIGSGEKKRLDLATVDAINELRRQQGDHPDIAKAWQPLLEDLQAERPDAKAIHDRLNDLLYPDTLEDVVALRNQVTDGLKMYSGGRINRDTLEAAKSLNDIKARKERKDREEREAEALERQQQRERDKKYRAAGDEIVRRSIGSIELSRKLQNATADERDVIIREFERGRQERESEWERILRELDD